MQIDLTKGSISRGMLLFAAPMILGNLLQQLYNIADTFIVGRFLGAGSLAAVGSSFTLMVFLTSIILGLCMGSGVVFSMHAGAREEAALKNSIFIAFVFIAAATFLINLGAFLLIDPLLKLLQIPADIFEETRIYLQIIFIGIGFTFIYNYFAALLRALGNSVAPLICLAVAALTNILLDLVLILVFHMGVAGAAWATITAQGLSALSIALYSFCTLPCLRLKKDSLHLHPDRLMRIIHFSLMTCIQQSIMNFGILMVQGLVNSFGVTVMAAFAAAVKIDAFAYMPVQDFGNAFSTYIAQNFGAVQAGRIRQGIRCAILIALIFCVIISLFVFLFAAPLMQLFIDPSEQAIIAIGAHYLRIEGACYCGIGCLFLLYGLYRGIGRAGISVILTVISLGTRVALAYLTAPIPAIGLNGIWWAIPIGWFLADLTGLLYWRFACRKWLDSRLANVP